MKRRDFLKTAGIGAVGATAAGCAASTENGPAVHTKKNIRWRLASSFPKGLDTIYGSAEVLSERLAQLSSGRFQIRSFQANEIVPAFEVLDAVQQGSVQVGHTASYYYIGKNPALAFDTAMPFGLTARQQTAWLYQGGGRELMSELLSDYGIKPFPCGNTGVQMGGWFRNEVGSTADLRGLRMRIPGLGGEVMSRLGVTVQTIPGGDTFPALERGAIDATEWVGPYDDEKLGFFKVAKNYYYPGWWEPGPGLSVYVNQAAWDTLDAEDQELFETACYEAHQTMQTRYDARNPGALERLLAEGVQLRPFPDDIMNAAHDTAFELMNEEAAKDAAYRKIFDAWMAFRREQQSWFSTAELHYASYRRS